MTTKRTPADVFGEQVRQTRKRKGLSQEDLAERLVKLGAGMHPTAITKLEKGARKKVTVAEAFAMAAALDVSPLALLLPRDDDELVAVSPGALAVSADTVRNWIAGDMPLTALMYTSDEGESLGYRTLDGEEIAEGEAVTRQRFYESETSNGQWRIRQVPGVAHLLRDAHAYARARATGDDGLARTILDLLSAEVDQQRKLLARGRGQDGPR